MTELPEIPRRMLNRPRDDRGFPIPFAQYIRPDGTADFRVLDHERVLRCLRARKCGLCGELMGQHIFFVGGSLCEKHGYFYDPPMHRDCAVYSLRACSHLNRAKGRYNMSPFPSDPGMKIIVGAMELKKSEFFSLMGVKAYTFGVDHAGMLTIKATLPWRSVERWRDGAPMEVEAKA